MWNNSSHSSKRKVYFHIGYPKTASTWLQNIFFPNVRNFQYVDDSTTKELFLKSDVFLFSQHQVEATLKEKGYDSDLLFSSELLTTAINFSWHQGVVSKACADRIKQAFPDATIILLIRKQQALLCSGYMQYIKNGGNHSIHRFMYSRDFFSAEHLFFDRLIEYYDSLFGKEKVKVFLFEEFIENPKHFMKYFCEELGLRVDFDNLNYMPVNRSLRNGLMIILRFLNLFHNKRIGRKLFIVHIPGLAFIISRFIKSLNQYSFFGRYLGYEDLLNKNDMAYLRSAYTESNRKLAKRIGGEKLLKHGYFL